MSEERIGVGLARREEGYRAHTGSNLGHCKQCRGALHVFGTLVRCIECNPPVPHHPLTLEMQATLEKAKKTPPPPAPVPAKMDVPKGGQLVPASHVIELPGSGVLKNDLQVDLPALDASKLPATMRPAPAKQGKK
jgi:hypothetical protein